jgi:ketosteroid isomerase-like protein
MRRILGIALAATVLLPAAVRAQADSAVSASVQREILPIMKEQMLAANAHDTDRFMEAYLRGSSLVFVFNGTVYNGWDALEAQQLKWWNNGKSDVMYDERGAPEFTVLSPDVAVVMSQLESRRTMPSGETSSGQFAVTAVWHRTANGWRIIQAHESTGH